MKRVCLENRQTPLHKRDFYIGAKYYIYDVDSRHGLSKKGVAPIIPSTISNYAKWCKVLVSLKELSGSKRATKVKERKLSDEEIKERLKIAEIAHAKKTQDKKCLC